MPVHESFTAAIPTPLREFVAFEASRTGVSESEVATLALGLLAHLRSQTFEGRSVVVRFDPTSRELRFETTVYEPGVTEAALQGRDTVGAYELMTRTNGDDGPPAPRLRLV